MKKWIPMMVETALVPDTAVKRSRKVAKQQRQEAYEKEIAEAVESLVQGIQKDVEAANKSVAQPLAQAFANRFFLLGDGSVIFDRMQGLIFPDPVHTPYRVALADAVSKRTAMNTANLSALAQLFAQDAVKSQKTSSRSTNQAQLKQWLQFAKKQGRLPTSAEAESILKDCPFLLERLKNSHSAWKTHSLRWVANEDLLQSSNWKIAALTRNNADGAALILPVVSVTEPMKTQKPTVAQMLSCLEALAKEGFQRVTTLEGKLLFGSKSLPAFRQAMKTLPAQYVSMKGTELQFNVEKFRKETLKEYRKAHPEPQPSAEDETAALDVASILLDCDKVRAQMARYPSRILTDLNFGHWDLYEGEAADGTEDVEPGMQRVRLPQAMVARPPQMDVHTSGTCAIDFGTKSTVVACRDRGERLLRVGKGNFEAAPQPKDYENPTVLEIRDLTGFRTAYEHRSGRPFTQWEQMTVSHQARAQLLNADQASGRQTVFSALKQWANRTDDVRHLQDRKGKDWILPPYDELEEGAADPIEYYAYYLGLYINNMANGIYLDYLLSYPVKYPKAVCEHLRQSFERGLKKSLPPAILQDAEVMQDFRVYLGASEPAAYASCALQELGRTHQELVPTAEHTVAYAVFDFGGGTTDFDYGIWRLPTPQDKGRWNYILEDFAAGSDLHLGGEKLLNQLAYRVFQDNLPAMREKHIPLVLPEDALPFEGGELLLNPSDAAYMNLERLSELVRPVWEASESEACAALSRERQAVVLFTDDGGKLVHVDIDIKVPALQAYLRTRIQRGIDNFFTGLQQAFKDAVPEQIHILLAGNSCRSALVQELFQAKIAAMEKDVEAGARKRGRGERTAKGMLQLYPPLNSAEVGASEKDTMSVRGAASAKGATSATVTTAKDAASSNAAPAYDRMPTGKTGVAFGLLDCRKGGHDVKIIDRNRTAEKEAPFPYYLGREARQNRFYVVIGKATGYGVWAPFLELDEDEDEFELYYTAEASALDNETAIDALPAPKRCRIHYTGAETGGWVYLRKVGPQTVEYTVAEEKEIAEGKTRAKIERVELEG